MPNYLKNEFQIKIPRYQLQQTFSTVFTIQPTIWYTALINPKQQIRNVSRKLSDLLNIVKNDIMQDQSISVDNPEATTSSDLKPRSIPAVKVPLKYKLALEPYVSESNFIEESKLMDMPPKPKDFDKMMRVQKTAEVNRVKQQFVDSIHIRSSAGITLRPDGCSYYMDRPHFFPSSDLYEVPGLKSELMNVRVPYKIDAKTKAPIDYTNDFDKREFREIYFAPKRLRKYPK